VDEELADETLTTISLVSAWIATRQRHRASTCRSSWAWRTKSLFEARSFDELVVAGRISSERRIIGIG